MTVRTPSATPGGRLAAALLVAAIALPPGCAHVAPAPAAPEVRLPAPLPPLVMSDASGTPEAPGGPAPLARRGRFAFRSTPVPDAIRMLFDGSDVNLMVAEDIEGTVTADFADATPEQVLDAVLRNHGLSMTYEDGYARIGTSDRRVFTLDYVAGPEYAGLWDEIAAQVQALISPAGKVTVSPNAGTLIVADRAENLDRVEAHLRHLEEIVGRQVQIEARVIEVTLNDRFQLGVDYGVFPRALGINGSVGGSAPGGNAILQSFTPAAGGIQAGIFRTGDFSVLLEALHSQGQVNVLSAPRVSTLNNRPATINVTEQVPVVSREVVGGEVDATSTRDVYDVTFEEAGIELEVTPQVGEDGSLTIRVHPRVTEVSGSVTTPDGLQTLPIINQRETNTVLKVRDGESIVLGGFIQRRRREEILKVPGLGDLPLVGALFRRTDQQEDRVELVILLTPHVLDANGIARAVADGLAGITDLARPFHFGILQGKSFDLAPMVRNTGFEPVLLFPVQPLAPETGGFTRVTRVGLARHLLQNGMLLLKRGEGARAEQEWLKALRFDPDLAEARFQLALLYAQRAQTGRAVRYFNEISGQRPTHPQGLNRIALALTAAGAFDPAIRILKQGLRHFPDDPSLLTNLGVCYLGKGESELADTAFARAAAVQPDAVEPVVNRAEILLARGGLEGARVLYESVLPHIPPGNPEFYLRVEQRIRAIDALLATTPAKAAEPAEATVPAKAAPPVEGEGGRAT